MVQISILPLPEETTFTKGHYGLETSLIRGLVRIHFDRSLWIQSLTLIAKGLTTTQFSDAEISTTNRTKVLFKEQVLLLEDIKLDLNRFLDIPFELQFPLFEPISQGFGPCSELLPPTSSIFGGDYYKKYSAHTFYSIEANLNLFTSIPMYYITEKASVNFPFKVYDPRLICGILHPEERRWKSHIGQKPIEYDISINSCVYGPGDTMILSYKILVDENYARRGTRVRKVSLTIKETHLVGEGRCCKRDDDSFNWNHGYPFRVRGSKEVFHWSTIEYPPPDNPYPRSRVYKSIKEEKYRGLATNPTFSVSDGIFVQRVVEIPLPAQGAFSPSNGRIMYPPDDHICKEKRPRDAFCQTRHVGQVTIDLLYGESISMDCILYISSITRKDGLDLLEKDPEILPSLDYEKLIGLEVWVPEYQEEDPLGRLDPDILKETFEANQEYFDDVIERDERESIQSSPPRAILGEEHCDEHDGHLIHPLAVEPESLPPEPLQDPLDNVMQRPKSPPPSYSDTLSSNQLNYDYTQLPVQRRTQSLERLVAEALSDSLV